VGAGVEHNAVARNAARALGKIADGRAVSELLVVLDDDEYRLYHEIYTRFVASLPRPSLVIYLQASVPTLHRRIARRGIGYEQGIDGEYLGRLCQEYVEFFHYYSDAPLLIVNAEEINLVDNPAHFELLLAEIERGVVGRRYFNPGLKVPG
jgi:deoxyadenosine/deoxycytidine kinase